MKLSDIAQLAGVSLTTASYVINGKAAQRRISAATVARVMAVVEAHGYQPDQRAAGLRRGATHTLGFLLPDLENPSYARLAKQLERRARARGYQLLIACTDDNPDSERQLIALFRARRCDGLFTASSLAEDDAPYRQLQEHNIPPRPRHQPRPRRRLRRGPRRSSCAPLGAACPPLQSGRRSRPGAGHD